MKQTILISAFLFQVAFVFAQTISDFDKNEYSVVTIGDQQWIKENLRTTHYSDGTPIKGLMKYNNSDSGTEVYGLIYTWNAAMHDSTTEGIQGVCPCGWHVPSKADWQKLFTTLGGANVAAIHLKEQGTSHWNSPNSGDNSSGFTALAAGFYNSDPKYIIGYISRGNVLGLWSSTQNSNDKAVQYAIANTENKVMEFNWLKTDAYSIRCVKNSSLPTSSNSTNKIRGIDLTIFPNPAMNVSTISVNTSVQTPLRIEILDYMGRRICHKMIDKSGVFDILMLPKGFYLLKTDLDNTFITKKLMIL